MVTGPSCHVITGLLTVNCDVFVKVEMGFVTAVHAGRSLEISNLVDIRSEVNYELAMRLVTDVVNDNRFYTDLNSFQVHSPLVYVP